ncbi:DUF3325 domain-containing protein [Alkalimonas sp. NCh-2]|uniref:DUF3325 domain-containing protein n=1 Tax=Alkalimonas sp. NCh-2 TaxID=3144846 RepID=UPI0031F6F008
MSFLLVFLLAVIGFTGLALSLDRHYRQVWQSLPSKQQRWRWRLCGWFCLLLSLVVSLNRSNWDHGLVFWFALLTLAALSVVLILSYRPTLLRGSVK